MLNWIARKSNQKMVAITVLIGIAVLLFRMFHLIELALLFASMSNFILGVEYVSWQQQEDLTTFSGKGGFK